MSLSAAEISDVVDTLTVALRDARIQRVRTPAVEPEALVLRLRRPGETIRLLLSAHPELARLHLVDHEGPAPSEPPPFVMLCRKHIEGARCEGITQVDGDRVVRIDLRRRESSFALIAELTGRHADLLLLGEDDRILGRLGAAPDPAGRRVQGERWTAPPPPPGPPSAKRRPDWPGAATELHAWLDEQTRHRRRRNQQSAFYGELRKLLRRERKKLRRKEEALARDLAAIDSTEELRHEADLLQAARGRVERGATEVRVRDWSTPAMEERTIELDPARSLQDNIDRRYRRARRLERGRTQAEQRQLATMEALEEIEQLTGEVDAAREAGAPAAQAAGLERRVRRRCRAPQRQAGRKKRESRREPFHRFRSSAGMEILVGRGGADNDELTFRIARGRDLWLHAADWAGAHVIIRCTHGQDVPRETLEEAALLAAHFSKGYRDSLVAVHWTERKHVRKGKGLAPGQVYLSGTSAIDVCPVDDKRLQALLDQGRR